MNTGFVGIGSMGGMLVRAFLRAKALAPDECWIANRSRAKLEALASEFSGLNVASNRKLATHCDLIFLCLKAGDSASALAEMDAELYPGQLLVTTASVIPLQALENRVPCRVAKLIPSITQEVGAGVALLMYGSRITAEDRKLLEELTGLISHPVVISEAQARPAIGLASGGPALIAYLLQSMAEEAARSNPEVSAGLAKQLIAETLDATAKLVREGKLSLTEIIERVAVPGGMTAQAIQILARQVPQAWESVFRESSEKERRERADLIL